MQLDSALRIASRVRLTSFSVKYKTGKQSLFECAESFTKERAEVDMQLCGFLGQYERARIIGMMEAGWSV
ncbi:hypothetical protein TNCV_2598341 [Trichonephila clavipes]|nr:hypothetical protein TNCV_2598341 [Trichonephila clavipes]